MAAGIENLITTTCDISMSFILNCATRAAYLTCLIILNWHADEQSRLARVAVLAEMCNFDTRNSSAPAVSIIANSLLMRVSLT